MTDLEEVEYFDFGDRFEAYKKKVGKQYRRDDPATDWWEETRDKLEYLVDLIAERLDIRLEPNYSERPNKRAGTGKNIYRNYVITGCKPPGYSPNDFLFIKIAIHEIASAPKFHIEIDGDWNKDGITFEKDEIEKIKNEVQQEWIIDKDFPDSWDELLNLIEEPFKKVLERYKPVAKYKSNGNPDLIGSVQKELIDNYKQLIKEDQNEEELYKWRLIQEFQKKWDIDADDFAAMAQGIDFKNLLDYRSKTLIHFVEEYPEEARALFKMLYDETIPLKKRIDEFGEQAEQLVKKYHPDKGAFQDERTVATYLTFRYPDKYTFYKFSFYSDYADLLEVDKPQAGERYIHYLDLIQKFIDEYISQDEELIQLSRETLTDDCYIDENLNILAQDILFRVIEEQKFPGGGEEDLKQILNAIRYPAATNYFTILDKLIESLDLSKGDQQVVYSTRTSENRLVFTIGQRYSLIHEAKKDGVWGFIHPKRKSKAGEFEPFSGPPEAYWHETEQFSHVKDELEAIKKACNAELNRTDRSGYLKYSNESFEKAVFDRKYRDELFKEVFDMESEFTWVETHKEIAQKLLNYRDRQNELVDMLRKAGVSSLRDQDENGDIDLTVIDPYSFFRFINKHGDDKRISLLSEIAEEMGVNSMPEDVTGLPTAHALIARLFPYKKNRTDEVDILWDVFEQQMSGEVTSEMWDKARSIQNVGKTNFTQALFTIDPEEYLPMDQHTEPYLEEVLNIETTFEAVDEYRNILSQVREVTNKPFYQISKDAYEWHTNGGGNGKSIEIGSINSILYGPPGTGKTYKLRNYYAPKFTQEQKLKTKEEFEVEVIEGLSWWEVIALSLLEAGDLTVPEIKEHRFIQIKESLSDTSSVNATIWGQLQTHTSPESTNVNTSNRQEPYLFDKLENSVWSLNQNDCKQKTPYLLEALESINHYESEVNAKQNYRFTTFHQSFTYEDFVEGIKPRLNTQSKDSDSEEIEYTIEKGVFYQAADEACKLAGFLGLQDCLSYSPEERKAKFSEAKPYALFIDEINRGNISAILGELITLIEDDKRLTRDHELIVQLPYSKKSFAVPPNLYILGTLNTADRSVEALDTALRRRFSFIEIEPDPNLLTDVIVDGINIEEVLRHINLRIVKLLDRDHKIGHSYFLPVTGDSTKKDLAKIFEDRVIPLLKEYFFGDFGKIGLVLGSSFVEEIHPDNTGIFAQFSGYEDVAAEYDERKVYTISPKHKWDFESIYATKSKDE